MARKTMVALMGSAFMIIGTFLPWVSAFGITANGFSRGSGAAIFIIVLAALIGLFSFIGKRWGAIVGVVLALLSAAWAVKQIGDASSVDGASAGIGLMLILAGSVAALVGCVMGFGRGGQPVEATA